MFLHQAVGSRMRFKRTTCLVIQLLSLKVSQMDLYIYSLLPNEFNKWLIISGTLPWFLLSKTRSTCGYFYVSTILSFQQAMQLKIKLWSIFIWKISNFTQYAIIIYYWGSRIKESLALNPTSNKSQLFCLTKSLTNGTINTM